jgi:hypothetical protein
VRKREKAELYVWSAKVELRGKVKKGIWKGKQEKKDHLDLECWALGIQQNGKDLLHRVGWWHFKLF